MADNFAIVRVRFCSSICESGTVIYTKRNMSVWQKRKQTECVKYTSVEPELYYAAHCDEIQKKGYSLVPSDIDRDTEIDYKSALSEMSDKFDALKKRWDANETELVNAFKILGYGKE